MKKSLPLILIVASFATIFPSTAAEREAMIRYLHQQGGVTASLLHFTQMLNSDEGRKVIGCLATQADKHERTSDWVKGILFDQKQQCSSAPHRARL